MGIGIVGGGIAALHLALALQKAQIDAVVYTARGHGDLPDGPLLNTVVHHNPTIARDEFLGTDRWPADRYGYRRHFHRIGGSAPVEFTGVFRRPSSAVDHRLYLPALAETFLDRGGQIRTAAVGARDLSRLASQHELVVIASGRGPLSGLFDRRASLSPIHAPQRRICAGLYTGIDRRIEDGVGISLAPDVGELLEIPIITRHGRVTALLFENLPDTEAAALSDIRPTEDGGGRFARAVLDLLRDQHPMTFERVDESDFGLTDPRDLLQGGVIPAFREDYFEIEDGVFALALGDAHVVVDPIMGLGANIAAYSAGVVADCIIDSGGIFDELFCDQVARARAEVLIGASQWTNLMLQQHPRVSDVMRAAARNPMLANVFTDNFDHPERQWRILATDRRAERFIAAGPEPEPAPPAT